MNRFRNRARRGSGGSSGFRPSSVGGGTLALWLRADMGVTLNAGNVSQWSDQSGNGRHLTQGVAGNQPLWVANGTNGKPAVRFDGSNDVLGPVTFTMNLPFTRVYVLKNTLGASGVHDIIADGGTALAAASQATTFPEWNMFPDSVDYVALPVADSVYAYVTEQWDTVAGVGALRVNGTAVQTGGAAAVTSGGFTLGASATPNRWAAVEFAEVIIYASRLSASALAAVETYVKTRYGL